MKKIIIIFESIVILCLLICIGISIFTQLVNGTIFQKHIVRIPVVYVMNVKKNFQI